MGAQMIQIGSQSKISARVDGEVGKPWIVLSNSLAADCSMWDDQMSLLTESYRVVRYDTRGHGLSDTPPGQYTFSDLVEDVVSVLDHFDILQADFMGLSLGGMTGLALVLTHPERIRRMICAACRADMSPAILASWNERAGAVSERGMGAVLEGTLSRWFTSTGRANVLALDRRATEMILRTSPDGYAGCVSALSQLDYVRRLSEIRSPTLYIAGEFDIGAPPGIMRSMTEATPGAKLDILSGAAHLLNMETPIAFNRCISSFLLLPRGDESRGRHTGG